jgi:glucose/arabinose dehydrogenase
VFEDLMDSNPNHNGGCLRFGPDAMLYLSVGEDEDLCAAQDSTLLKGAILRLDVSALPAGSGGPPALDLITPDDNPLATSNANAKIVWAYGMRNPFRFHVDPANGTLFACDVGEADFEEINEVGPGQNFGWPYREGNLVISRPGCPEPPGKSYRSPMFSMNRSTSLTAIVGAGIYRWPMAGTANWPGSYQGLVFYSEYYSGFLRRLVRNGTTWGPAPVVAGQPNANDWGTGLVAAVDFLVGPDGSLWWLGQFNSSLTGSTGSLNRIRFTGSPVDAPIGRMMEASLSGAPNPFRSSADVWFRLAERAPVTLTVHDLAGRRVRELLRGTAEAGDTRVTWDGRDDSGLSVPAGLYFVRLDRGRSVETTRLLHLK